MRKFVITFALMIFVANAFAQQKVSTEELDDILSDFYDEDLAMNLEYQHAQRRNLTAAEMEVYNKKKEAMEVRHQKYVENLLDKQGWPEDLSIKANRGLFSVIDNADYPFAQKYYPMIEEQVKRGNIDPAHSAALEDRILMQTGKKQKYGTQTVTYRDGDKVVHHIWPVEEPADLDARRERMNLAPMTEYVDLLSRSAGSPINWDRTITVESLQEKLKK